MPKGSATDVFKVSASNVVKLLAGALVAFVLPKLIGVSDYGYFKTFTLYATYVGLFHLGICDGIYLKYGGRRFSELDKAKFRFYSRAFLLVETIIAIALGVAALLLLEGEWLFICLSLSVYLLFTNVTGYYQIISQVTSRFGELSARNVIQSGLIALAVACFWTASRVLGVDLSYRWFLAAYVGVFGLLAAWYAVTYRSITFGPRKGAGHWRDLGGFARIGIPLTVANLCSSLILTLDRQFVSILFDIDTYALYAFAYNMLSLVTTVLTAVSTVLYPKLKQLTEARLREMYPALMGGVIGLVSVCLVVYFPLSAFVEWYLPAYVDSLEIFRVILPGLALSSCITIVMHNYYKVLGENSRFFRQTLVVLGLSLLGDAVAYMVFKTPISVSVASVIVIAIWYAIAVRYLTKRCAVPWGRDVAILGVAIGAFYGCTAIGDLSIGAVLYAGAAALIAFRSVRHR